MSWEAERGSGWDDPSRVPTVAELDVILRRCLPHNAVYAIRPTGDPFTGWARMMLGAPPEPDGPRSLTREEAVEKALLFTFQLSNKDYRKMQAALSEVAFIRALEQDGYTVAPAPPEPRPSESCPECGRSDRHLVFGSTGTGPGHSWPGATPLPRSGAALGRRTNDQ